MENIELKLKVKKYLELDNVSILAGAGTSWHLGAPVIRNIPDELKKELTSEIETYFGNSKKDPSFEDLVNCLQASKFLTEKNGKSTETIDKSINKMQQWLFENCNTDNTTLKNEEELLKNNRYFYHELLIKKLLQRPNNLQRANLFTTNYDMAFDYALDNLGVHYINGFMGVHNRFFRPEVYEYDIFYPGESVSGKVHRAEKVLRYYKIHGSLSWVSTEPTVSNIYGIEEISLHGGFSPSTEKQLMIYPCVSKKTFTLDLPYSELFRQFAHAINKPQSVLICLGYSFYDEHINDLIFQALSNPSFTLIIANYTPKENNKTETKDNIKNPVKNDNLQTTDNFQNPNNTIQNLKNLRDPRIIFTDAENEEQSTFIGFVKNIMPDLYEEDENKIIAETMKTVYNKEQNNEPE